MKLGCQHKDHKELADWVGVPILHLLTLFKRLFSIVPFSQEKAQVGAYSVIVKTDGSFAALL